MKRYAMSILCVGLCVLYLPLSLAAQEMSADRMLQEMESILFPDSFFMVSVMETHRPDRRDSEMALESYHKEGAGSLIEITAPARSRGIRFLQKDETLWMFNPRSNSRRAIRLSPRDSFQGSMFSNNDVGDTTYVDDYEARYGEHEVIDHQNLGRTECYVILADAKHPEAAYGSIKAWLRKDDLIPLRMEYYAKSGLLFKRMELSELKTLAGRTRPSVMRMESLEMENAWSVVTIEELEVRENLPDRIFTEANLTR